MIKEICIVVVSLHGILIFWRGVIGGVVFGGEVNIMYDNNSLLCTRNTKFQKGMEVKIKQQG